MEEREDRVVAVVTVKEERRGPGTAAAAVVSAAAGAGAGMALACEATCCGIPMLPPRWPRSLAHLR